MSVAVAVAPPGIAARRPPRRPRKFQRIVAAIREDVFGGRLRAGDQLPDEPGLAERFGVSRLAVREALRVLEFEGIVRVAHGFRGGAFVAQADSAPVAHALGTMLRLERLDRKEVYAARRSLEPVVTAMAARAASPDALHLMGESISATEALVRDRRRAFASNLEFHAHLAASCGNRVLSLMSSALLELLREVESRIPSDAASNRESCSAHRAILAALEARDPDLAERRMAGHLRWLERYYLSRTVEGSGADRPAAKAGRSHARGRGRGRRQ